MRNIRFLVLLLLFGLTDNAFCDLEIWNAAGVQREYENDFGFQLVTRLCLGHDNDRFGIAFRSATDLTDLLFSEGATGEHGLSEISGFFKNGAISVRDLTLIQSTGFQMALQRCFSGDLQGQKQFMRRYFIDIYLGELLGISGLYFGGRLIYVGFNNLVINIGIHQHAKKIFVGTVAIGTILLETMKYLWSGEEKKEHSKIPIEVHENLIFYYNITIDKIDQDLIEMAAVLTAKAAEGERSRVLIDRYDNLLALRREFSNRLIQYHEKSVK